MYEIEKRNNDIPSVSKLSKLGVSAVGYTAGGIFLFILNAVTTSVIPGLIIGGLVFIFGLSSFLSKDPADKKAGFIITAAGILTIISKIKIPFLAPLSGAILGIGAVGLLALGIWNGIKFFIGLKKRS
ncbi:MAG: hypothetical protein FWC19_07820 [Treponema sp.]|nr:hypothetical protein [Treponema sp.]MCL2272689.1 hypothetical protein [Treponema sp.]